MNLLALSTGTLILTLLTGCAARDLVPRWPERGPYLGTDSMGVLPETTAVPLQARRQLSENSAVTASRTQPGVFFMINDSGNDPILFAFDSTGADRGAWRVDGARNVDWESASTGPCSAAGGGIPGSAGAGIDSAGAGAPARVNACVYIGDTGDNDAKRSSRVIYKVVEPKAERAGFIGELSAQALVYTYADGPHDVEAMYVAPNGATYLITKRRLLDQNRRPRPSLVFELPAEAWSRSEPAIATLVDSLPIVPGSVSLRLITDAALSPDDRSLAVRTYAQVYVFATDSSTGRVRHDIAPGVCNIVALAHWQGEGVAWFGQTGKLALTSEGRRAPMYVVECPRPR